MTTASQPPSQPFTGAAVVMGVASCGKTTIGEALARQLGVAFTEGDRLHSPENVAKMSSGIPLTDDDRWPWLAKVGAALQGSEGHIVSCSALKKSYRQAIAKSAKRPVKFVHLHGARPVLEARISSRQGHFMPASLLDSQLATLEIPTAVEDAKTIDIDQCPEAIVKKAMEYLLPE